MAAQSHFEGQSVNRPPLFDGEDYTYWMTKMEYYLQGHDYQIWSIVEEESLDNIEDSKDSDDEEAMLSKRLQRILAKKKKFQSGRRYFKKNKDLKRPDGKDQKRNEPLCYECKKPGHIKADCPMLKKNDHKKKDNSKKFRRYKKKAMAAAWENSSDSDSESSSSSEEEEANLAFMANTGDKKE
ncbi:hypothetical protein Taro_032423 [Colocasia esculenta]|uniref:CCHC-type domain-containing protein n=1 Tax=Colocasia esculenta TaxID=4460 RepID=A0A843W1W1_COLES|nr:hypothetical protein [Colocasia esculenta]